MTAQRQKKPSNTGKARRPAKGMANQKKDAPSSKLDLLVAMLSRPMGASLTDLIAATGWQAHSVRGAIAGGLKKKGHTILSEKIDGRRQYRITSA